MSSQEEHNKLNDKEKFKLIEFYQKDPGKNVSCIKSWLSTRAQKVSKRRKIAE